jgi:hypothetical protein
LRDIIQSCFLITPQKADVLANALYNSELKDTYKSAFLSVLFFYNGTVLDHEFVENWKLLQATDLENIFGYDIFHTMMNFTEHMSSSMLMGKAYKNLNGNTSVEDGIKYPGRGLLPVPGKNIYDIRNYVTNNKAQPDAQETGSFCYEVEVAIRIFEDFVSGVKGFHEIGGYLLSEKHHIPLIQTLMTNMCGNIDHDEIVAVFEYFKILHKVYTRCANIKVLQRKKLLF